MPSLGPSRVSSLACVKGGLVQALSVSSMRLPGAASSLHLLACRVASGGLIVALQPQARSVTAPVH